MWNYYLGGNPTDLIQVAKYCVIDAKRCQDLMVKKNVYNEYREVASLAFVSYHDVYLNANGIRVLNLVAAEANGTYVMNMQSNDDDDVEGDYQGAYVFKPEKGLVPDPVRIKSFEEACAQYRETKDKEMLKLASDLLKSDRPVTGLDFSSLYPSIIMAYNFSPEKLILIRSIYEELKDHINLYSINIDGDVKGWSVRHNNGKMGLYPTILKTLFDKRKMMKKEMHIHGVKKEQMDVVIAKKMGNIKGLTLLIDEVKANIKSLSSTAELSEIEENKLNNDKNNLKILEEIQLESSTEEEFQELYEKTEFKLKHCDSKQKALKVYMNTFYGVTGLTSSPLFQLEIAAGITSAGRYNIQMVEKFVRKLGFHIKYGDTDSLYLSPPCSAFYKCDREYASKKINKEEWYRKMVEITMIEVGKLQKKVNDFLEQDNGTKFLKMAYEEVLFPVLFAGKKKYCGIPHEAEIIFNTDRNRLFIKGMDVVKSNQTQFSINTMYETIQTLLDINNTKTLLEIVHETIDKAKVNIASQDIGSFILYKKWKPPLIKCQYIPTKEKPDGKPKQCTTKACYKFGGQYFCQAHSICYCKKCTNRAKYVSANGNYYCGIHKQQKHNLVDPDDSNLYQGTHYTQYDKEMWTEGKGTPSVLSYISRVYDDRKKKQIINERKIKQNGGSSEGLQLETIVEMPEFGDEIPHVITLAESNFHLNGNVYKANVGDRMESPEKVLSGEKQIDFNYYLENQLCGQLARVINGLPQFEAEDDAKSQEMAKKYLGKYFTSKKQEITGKDIKKQYDPILKEAIVTFDVTTQFVKLLASEGLNKGNCNKRIEECIDVKSSSRIFIESALELRGIRPDGYNIGDCKSNSKLAELKTSLNNINVLGVKSEFNSLRSDARKLTNKFIDEHYDDLVFNISQFQECVKAIYKNRENGINITFDDLPEYDFSDLTKLNDKLIKISLLYKKRNEIIKLKEIVPSLYVHTVNKVFTPDSASKVLAEQMKLLKQKK
jgi:DNA polymerase elongation subunit (family B)